MSGFRRSGSARGIDSLSDLLKDSLPSCYTNKPDSRQHDVFSPVSPLRPTRRGTGAPSQSGAAAKITTTTTTARSSSSSSSSSSGSVSDRVGRSTLARKSHSDEISGNSGGGIRRPGHCRSKSSGSVGFRLGDSSRSSYGGGSVSSPQVNVLPAGNIIPSGRIPPTGLTREPARKDVLGSGKGNYGHGSIIRGCVGGGGGCSRTRGDSEEWNRAGHEAFEKGNYADAIGLFDRAITAAPGIASYRINLATAMGKMGRVVEAVEACEVALRLESHCSKADHLMACLLLRLGQVQAARKHLGMPGLNPIESEMRTLEAIEMHLGRCSDARQSGDWVTTLKEACAAIASGANRSPQLLACRAECHLKLLKLEDAEGILELMEKDTPTPGCCSDGRFFGMLSKAYPSYVRAQIDLACGRFADAAATAQKAAGIDPKNAELTSFVSKVKAVTIARNRGNDLVKSNRLTEACAAYDEGLALDPLNAVLHCNRAACTYMLKKWDQCVEDCNNALRSLPNYSKALWRRAFSYLKLEKWAQAIEDFQVLKKQWPNNKEYVEGLSLAQASLKKAHKEELEEILNLEQFRAVTSSKGIFMVYFFGASTDSQGEIVSTVMDLLKCRYPAVIFLKVDVNKRSEISNAENVKTVPTVKIYKNGSSVKRVVNPTLEQLDALVRKHSNY